MAFQYQILATMCPLYLLCCTFAIGCAMDPTHPPVKVLLTDGLYQRLVSPVEQIHH